MHWQIQKDCMKAEKGNIIMYWLGTGGLPGAVWLGWVERLDWVCSRSGCWREAGWESAEELESEEDKRWPTQTRLSILV